MNHAETFTRIFHPREINFAALSGLRKKTYNQNLTIIKRTSCLAYSVTYQAINMANRRTISTSRSFTILLGLLNFSLTMIRSWISAISVRGFTSPNSPILSSLNRTIKLPSFNSSTAISILVYMVLYRSPHRFYPFPEMTETIPSQGRNFR